MIKLLKNSQIDLEKYDQCVGASSQMMIYALSWYLNISCEDWDCIVLDDYQAVMPVPYSRIKRNLYRKKVNQPPYSQQLGIFSVVKLSNEVFREINDVFLSTSPKSYHFNAGNRSVMLVGDYTWTERVNFELDLSPAYVEIKAGYSKNLKRNIAKAGKVGLAIRSGLAIADYIKLKKHCAIHPIKQVHYNRLESLVQEASQRGMVEQFGVYQANELVAAAICLKGGNRIIHLSSSSTEQGKISGAIPFLFDRIISDYSESEMIFDFEGSMLEGVARFFKGFGSANAPYLCYFS